MTKTVADFIVAEFAGPISFWFNKILGRYINASTGRMVSEKTILQVGKNFTDQYVKPRLASLTSRFVEGKIEVAAWQERMALEIKNSYIVNMALGKGGRANLTPSDWGKLGSMLKQEYRALDGFAQQIASGKLSDAMIQARAETYVSGARKAYFEGLTRSQGEAGYDEERRVLNPAEHCDDCIEMAMEGWVPIGSLPEPGEGSRCDGNCQCEKEYRNSAQEEGEGAGGGEEE